MFSSQGEEKVEGYDWYHRRRASNNLPKLNCVEGNTKRQKLEKVKYYHVILHVYLTYSNAFKCLHSTLVFSVLYR